MASTKGKHTPSVFEDLLNEYQNAAAHRGALISDIEQEKERITAELGKVQHDLSKNAFNMSAEEHRNKAGKEKNLFTDLDFTNDHLTKLKQKPIVSDEEAARWIEKCNAEYDRIRAILADETMRAFKALADCYTKYITEFEKLRQLKTDYQGAAMKIDYPTNNVPELPAYIRATCRLLLIYYNELGKKTGELTEETKLFNAEELRKGFKDIYQITSTLTDESYSLGISVPSWDEAFNELKFNKPFEV